MIRLVRMSLAERLKRRLLPRYRAQRDEQLRLVLRWLIEHPEEPCLIEKRAGCFDYIPDGFGEPPTP